MGTVLSNERLTDGVYHLKVETNSGGAMGQFYMLRAWGAYPILSRPLSIHEVHEDSVEFLYHVVGEGTEILSRLGSGDSVELEALWKWISTGRREGCTHRRWDRNCTALLLREAASGE